MQLLIVGRRHLPDGQHQPSFGSEAVELISRNFQLQALAPVEQRVTFPEDAVLCLFLIGLQPGTELQALQQPRRVDTHIIITVEDTIDLAAIAKMVVVPNNRGEATAARLLDELLEIVFLIVELRSAVVGGEVSRDTQLTDDHTETFVGPLRLGPVKGLDELAFVFRRYFPFILKSLSPIIVAVGLATAIVIRIVVVELHAESVLGGIGRDDQVLKAVVGIAGVSLHNEHTLGIVATCGAHGVDERLVVTVLHVGLLLCGCLPVDLSFVDAGKSQVRTVVLEACGNLLPQRGQLLVVLFLLRIEGMLLQPSLVMGVDDDFHLFVQAVVDHLLNTVHPLAVDGHRFLVGEMAAPLHRDAHTVEALRLHSLDHFTRRHGVAPSRLVVAFAFETVAEIPSEDDRRGPCLGVDVHLFSRCSGSRRYCQPC